MLNWFFFLLHYRFALRLRGTPRSPSPYSPPLTSFSWSAKRSMLASCVAPSRINEWIQTIVVCMCTSVSCRVGACWCKAYKCVHVHCEYIKCFSNRIRERCYHKWMEFFFDAEIFFIFLSPGFWCFFSRWKCIKIGKQGLHHCYSRAFPNIFYAFSCGRKSRNETKQNTQNWFDCFKLCSFKWQNKQKTVFLCKIETRT